MSATTRHAQRLLRTLDKLAPTQQLDDVHARLPDPADFALACGQHRAPRFDREARWTRWPPDVTCHACRAVFARYPSMLERMREEAESEAFADRLEAERLESDRIQHEADLAAERAEWIADHAERGFFGSF